MRYPILIWLFGLSICLSLVSAFPVPQLLNINGHPFRLGKQLGEGVYGEVFRAESDDKAIAIKFLSNREDAENLSVEDEIDALKRMGYWIDDDITARIPYIAFILFEGDSLKNYIEKHPVISLETARNLTLAIREAVRQVWAKNQSHGDVHPGNIIIQEKGKDKFNAVMVDFGHSQSLDDLTSESVSELINDDEQNLNFIVYSLFRHVPKLRTEVFEGDYKDDY